MVKKIHLAGFIVTLLLLQGCAAVVLGSGAIATKTIIDPRTVGVQVDDTTLYNRVSMAIRKDETLKGARIVVSTYKGGVLLVGQSPDVTQISRAERVAQGVEGVNEVYNLIRVGTPIGLAAISTDSWITTKVKTNLLADKATKSGNFRVVTENSEVFMLGIVSAARGDRAAKIASRVSGVKLVTKLFSYE